MCVLCPSEMTLSGDFRRGQRRQFGW